MTIEENDKGPAPACFGNYERDQCLKPGCPVKVKCREYTEAVAKVHPCSCLTCDKPQFHAMGLVRCRVNGELIHPGDPQRKVVEKLGCMFHPDSVMISKIREILKGMTEENCCGEMNSDKCQGYFENGECTLCKFDYAIAQIRGNQNG